MRYALFATTSLVALALASYACSSSDDNKGTGTADAGKTSSSSSGGGSSGSGDDDDNTSSSGSSGSGDDDDTTSSSSSGSTSSGDSGASSSGASSGSTSSGGSPFDAGPDPGAENQTTKGTKCTAGDQEEKLPDNNTPAKAVALTGTTGTAKTSFCGSIEGGTDTTDYWTYTFNVTGNFSYSAGASYSDAAPTVTIITEGKEYPFSQNNIPVKSGVPVLFKVTKATKVDYRINFDVTQN